MVDRRYERVQMAVTTVLYRDNLAIIGGKTRDISLGGVFIETGPITLPIGTSIELRVIFDGSAKEQLFRLDAEVVHRSSQGMGLAFLIQAPEEFSRRLHNAAVEAETELAPIRRSQHPSPRGKSNY